MGAFIGSVLGFVGAGGAMLSVPILLYIFHFQPHEATTAALVIATSAALSGAVAKARRSEILYRDALIIWGIGSITNVALSLVAQHLPNAVITLGFASVMTLAGASMLRNPLTLIHARIPFWSLILISLVIGSITGLFGIGGGFLAIPVLVLYFGTPQAVAAGTSMLIIALNSITAFLGHHATWSSIAWEIPLLMSAAALVISMVASHHSHKVPAEKLRRYFAYLLFTVAVFTVLKTLLQF
jgi:uncharacterized membrane protein YfcA